MEDWQLAIGIVSIAIIIAIILSKRSWAHKKKKRKPIEHYTKTRDKLSGVDDTESTNPIGTVFAIILGLIATFFIVKFIMWIFSKVPGWVAALAPPPSMNTTGWSDNSTSAFSSLTSGNFNVLNMSPFLIVTILFTFMLFGTRVFRRNGVLIFIFIVPILYFLGVSLTWKNKD